MVQPVLDVKDRNDLNVTVFTINPNGQAAMVDSQPVVLASNQPALAVTLAGSATAALQTSGNTSLSSLDGKTTAVNTGAVTVVSTVLPTGASTAAKQPALGVAGTPSVDVITVQGAATITALKVDGSAVTQPVNASALPLPTGASTSALQTTGNNSLASIDSKITAVNTGAVTVISSALPTGASTSALQTSGNASLTSIDTKTLAAGQGTMAASSPVVIASNQSTLPISAASLPLPTGAATETTNAANGVLLGAIAETAPASDTASSGLNGRLQRIAQRITAMIAQLPATLGIKTAVNSLSVAPASDARFVIGDATNAVDVSTSGADAISNTINRLRVSSLDMVFNGSTVDRARGGVTGETGAATGYTNVLVATGAVSGASTISSTAYEASRVLKASAGTLIAIVGYNSKGSSQFIQIHNTTTVPADTAAPIATFLVPAATNFSLAIPTTGLPMSVGISVCNSSTGPTKTIGSADCYFTAVIK